MRIDTASIQQLCPGRAAARSACTPASRIGFGLFSLDARGYDLGGGGETQLTWAIDAYLGEPQRRGDAASVVLSGTLLGADLVGALLTPGLGTSLPRSTTTVGGLVRRASGRYGVELRFPKLPVPLGVLPAPITLTPARLELSLSAVRNVRQNFVRRVKVPTPSGSEIRKIADHRLVGHYLLRTPKGCRGSWPAEVRVGLTGRVERLARPIACTTAAALPGA